MTEAEALKILTPPLKFGDPKQIEAHQFLERLNKYQEKFNKCEEKFNKCEDMHSSVDSAMDCECMSGVPDEIAQALRLRRKEDCHCPTCGGEGVVECPDCDGSGEL